MKYLNDDIWTLDLFLSYCEEHSKTEKSLFHKNHIAEICWLLGEKDLAQEWATGDRNFVSISLIDDVRKIRKKRLIKSNNIKDSDKNIWLVKLKDDLKQNKYNLQKNGLYHGLLKETIENVFEALEDYDL
ncbi:MAG: hypothetical protein ACOCVF_01010 [bacterium]